MGEKRIKKQFWLTEEQAADLAKKARLTKLKEVTLIRMLLDGYRPREAPGMAFFYDTNRMITAAEHLAEAARTQTDPEVKEALLRECNGLKELRFRLMQEYLSLDRE